MEQVIMVELIPCLFRIGRKEKTHAAPYGFQEATAWVSRGSWSEFPPNQRNVTEGSLASAAAVVSQQGRQASPAPAWLVNIFIAMCKLNPHSLDESSKDRRKFSRSGPQRCGKRCYTFDK
jgi:hypothetical protein